LKFKKQRYQKGSVRKVARSQGFAWEFRFYYTDEDGKRKEKVQTLDSSDYATEFEVRKAMESQMSVGIAHGPIIREMCTHNQATS